MCREREEVSKQASKQAGNEFWTGRRSFGGVGREKKKVEMGGHEGSNSTYPVTAVTPSLTADAGLLLSGIVFFLFFLPTPLFSLFSESKGWLFFFWLCGLCVVGECEKHAPQQQRDWDVAFINGGGERKKSRVESWAAT